MLLKKLFRDARHFQVIFQLIFLVYGSIFLQWNTEWFRYLLYISTVLLCQQTAWYMLNRKKDCSSIQKADQWKSALITGLSLCLLLKTNHWWVAVLAAAISISGKYFFRIHGRHVFNPSALGIVVTIIFTGNAWISPGQWGNNTILVFTILCLGCIMVTKVQQLDVSFAFAGTYSLLLFTRQVIYLGWSADFFVQSITSGSLLLFSFFMITDPKTTPDHPVARITWAMAVAAFAFYLSAFQFVNVAAVWALVVCQPLVPLLNFFFRSSAFEWQQSRLKKFAVSKSAIMQP